MTLSYYGVFCIYVIKSQYYLYYYSSKYCVYKLLKHRMHTACVCFPNFFLRSIKHLFPFTQDKSSNRVTSKQEKHICR